MKHKKRRNPFIILAVCAVLLWVVAGAFAESYKDLSFYKHEIDNLKEEISNQKELSKELDEKEKLYASDDYIEQVARETLGLVKSDEKVFKNYNDN